MDKFSIAELTADEVAHILHPLGNHPKLQGKILTQFNDQLNGVATLPEPPKAKKPRTRKSRAKTKTAVAAPAPVAAMAPPPSSPTSA